MSDVKIVNKAASANLVITSAELVKITIEPEKVQSEGFEWTHITHTYAVDTQENGKRALSFSTFIRQEPNGDYRMAFGKKSKAKGFTRDFQANGKTAKLIDFVRTQESAESIKNRTIEAIDAPTQTRTTRAVDTKPVVQFDDV